MNAVAAKLVELDNNFTPHAGLREFNDGRLTPGAVPIATGRILLFIHGTFSNNDKLIAELAIPRRRSFLISRS